MKKINFKISGDKLLPILGGVLSIATGIVKHVVDAKAQEKYKAEMKAEILNDLHSEGK